jgi:GT2 family glycosyltransferase
MPLSVAVVILNYNGQHHLETFLPSVVEHSGGATIYVADNASTDKSCDFLQKQYPQIQLIRNTTNSGFAGGYNQALNYIEEDIYVLLNSDVEVSKHWIPPIVELFEKEEKVAIVQPKIKDYKHKEYFEYAGAAGGFIDFLGYPFCRGRLFQSLEKDQGQYDTIKEIFWASGACMFIRKKVYRDLGGLDEHFFAHMEEIDLCWRAKNQGHKVMLQPQSVVYHLGGGTLQNTNPRKTFLNFRNSLIALKKNDQSRFTFIKILLRLILDAAAFLKLWKESGLVHAMAIVRAHRAFYKFSGRHIKASSKPNLTGMYHHSLVIEYFLKGRRKFSQLKNVDRLS